MLPHLSGRLAAGEGLPAVRQELTQGRALARRPMAYPPGSQTTGRDAIQALWEKVLASPPRFEPESPLPTLVSGDIALTATVARDGTGVRRRWPAGSPTGPGPPARPARTESAGLAPASPGLARAAPGAEPGCSPHGHVPVSRACQTRRSMDVTTLARTLIEPVPCARRRRPGGGACSRRRRRGRVGHPAHAHQPGRPLHSSGLITLADAAGLAAIIAARESEDEMRGVLPLGARGARVPRAGTRPGADRVLPAQRGRVAGSAAGAVRGGAPDRLGTVADVTDEAHALVCRGTFDWSVRRTQPAA